MKSFSSIDFLKVTLLNFTPLNNFIVGFNKVSYDYLQSIITDFVDDVLAREAMERRTMLLTGDNSESDPDNMGENSKSKH